MLLPRFITALIGLPLLLLSIWWGQVPFLILICGIALLALYEFYTLADEASWPVSKRTGLVCGAFLAVCIALFGTKMGWDKGGRADLFFTPAALSLALFALVAGRLFAKDKENAFLDIAITWLGIFYVVWSFCHLLLIRDLRPEGRIYTFFLFIVIWILDMAAYFAGTRFGRTKLSEQVSPKKTWEGAILGSGAALIAALVCWATFLRSLSLPKALALAVLIVVVSQLSDLSESLFKRNVQVKDSGSVLPGHGGFLDRFDSFLLTAPAYYYAIVLFVR